MTILSALYSQYFKSARYLGDNIAAALLNYKIHVDRKCDVINITEFISGVGKIANSVKMGEEAPFRYPDDKEGGLAII
jgi:hypothetical protein